MMRLVLALCLTVSAHGFAGLPPAPRRTAASCRSVTSVITSTTLWSTYEPEAPSDFNTEDISGEKHVEVDEREEDAIIRDALKRELLLLSSITNRGEYASTDDQNVITDLVAQLEALNPTQDPARNCEGEWDLAMSSTPFFQTSPFFQSIRVAMGDDNKAMAENLFDLHDRVTTSSRIGRVRQVITSDEFVSEVDLEVGLPGLPVRVKGTVCTTASLSVQSSETMMLEIKATRVKGSNVPLLNQFLDDVKIELPVGSFYQQVQGKVPQVPLKTFYLDEAMRITRDVDDNFFVFTRA
jgi:hypothetical protein